MTRPTANTGGPSTPTTGLPVHIVATCAVASVTSKCRMLECKASCDLIRLCPYHNSKRTACGMPSRAIAFRRTTSTSFAIPLNDWRTRELWKSELGGLTSSDPEGLKNGLSNVLYWGYAQMGIRDIRVQRFRSNVNVSELNRACDLFQRSTLPSVLEIKKLRLPEFSGLSFVSKIRTFLGPR